MASPKTELPLSEAQFTAWLLDLARTLGWKAAHFHDSRRQVRPDVHVGDKDAKGFPDVVLIRAGRLIFAELKVGKATPSAEQREWLRELKNVEITTLGSTSCRVWTPSDRDEIEHTLR